QPHGDAPLGHVALGLGNGELAEVEDAGREHRVGAADRHAVGEVRELAHATRGDHGHFDGVADRAGQGQVETLAGAVAIHARQQDLAGTEPHDLRRPCDDLESGGAPPAVGEYLPAALARGLGVDRRHDALRAVAIRRVGDETRVLYPRRVDRYLVGARIEQPADILDTAHA